MTLHGNRNSFHGREGVGQFFSLGYPLLGSQVAVGRDPDHEPEGALLHSRAHLNATHSRAPDLNAVLFIFQFDFLVLQGIINHPDHLTENGLGLGIPLNTPYFEQVWPIGGRLWWPSEQAHVPRHPTGPTSATEDPLPDVPT